MRAISWNIIYNQVFLKDLEHVNRGTDWKSVSVVGKSSCLFQLMLSYHFSIPAHPCPPVICPKTCSWGILEHMEGGWEGGNGERREEEWGREMWRCRIHCQVARKQPYCFQGPLAFPFRATRGLPSPLRRFILNKQISLSPQTCLYLVRFPLTSEKREQGKGFTFYINKPRCGTGQAL